MKPRTLTVILLAVTMSACAMTGKDNIEPPAKLESFDATLPVKQLWSISFGDASDLRLALAPATDGYTVYGAGRNGDVRALDLESGAVRWTARADRSLTAGPGFGDGIVVVASADGHVLAFDAEDGTPRWRTRVSNEVLAAPAVASNVVAVRTVDGRLHGLDVADGAVLWSHDQSAPALILRGSSGPVMRGDNVISGFPNGKVTANQLRDGRLVWETAVGEPVGRTEIERMVDVSSTPRIVGRDLYAVSFQGRLVAMSVDTGQVLWSRDISSSAGLDAVGLGVWVTDENSEIVAFDRLSGNDLWRQGALRARWLTAPTAIGDAIAVGDLEGWLHLLSQDSGEFLARVRVDSDRIGMPPVAIRDILLVQSDGGRLIAYRVGGE